MKKLLLLSAVIAAAALVPMTASAASAKSTGVVVARSGQLIAIASPSGAVQTVRSNSSARVGARVSVSGSAVRVIGRSHSAHFRGVVVGRSSGKLVIAAGQSLVAVRMHARRFSSLGSADAATPTIGTAVDTTTSISNSGQLAVSSMSTGGSVGTIQIQATIQSIAGNVITLTVNGSPVQFTLPAGVTLPANLAGQAITLTLNLSGGNPVATPGTEQGDDNENDDQDEQGDNQGDHQHDSGGGGD